MKLGEKVEYEVVNPVCVHETQHTIIAIPEGGTVGFDGESVYTKNFAGVWRKTLTEKKYLLQWIENGDIKRKFLPKNQVTEEIKRAYTPRQQKAISSPPPVPPIEEGVLANPSLLPVVLPT